MATHITSSLFNYEGKICRECHCDLPKKYPKNICPSCEERLLFSRVKDYIRSNDVTEYDVAREFDIPNAKVKGWIREGRIEYKELHRASVNALFCQQCGRSITFGSLCIDCLRKTNISGSATFTGEDEDRFRFIKK